MAEKKAPAKSATAKSKSPSKVASKSTSTAAKGESAATKAGAKATAQSAGEGAEPAGSPSPVATRGSCTASNCSRPLRAKGYCRKHFMAWRRGKLGTHHHYKICSKEACRKQRAFGGLCAEHAGKVESAPPAAAASS